MAMETGIWVNFKSGDMKRTKRESGGEKEKARIRKKMVEKGRSERDKQEKWIETK